jgi:hypothetical protein
MVVCFLNGEYMAFHHNDEKVLRDICPDVAADGHNHIKRILKHGCTERINYEMLHKFKIKMIEKVNQTSDDDNQGIMC